MLGTRMVQEMREGLEDVRELHSKNLAKQDKIVSMIKES